MATADREREAVHPGPAAAAAAASTESGEDGAALDESVGESEESTPATRSTRRRRTGSAKSKSTRSTRSRANKASNGTGPTDAVDPSAAADVVEKSEVAYPPAEDAEVLVGGPEGVETENMETEAPAPEPVVIVIEPRRAPVEPEPDVQELPAQGPLEVLPFADEPAKVEESAPPADEESVAFAEEPTHVMEEPEPLVEEPPPPAASSTPADEPPPAEEEARPNQPRPHPLLAEAPPLETRTLEAPAARRPRKRFTKITIIVMSLIALLIMGISTAPAYYISSRAEPIYGARATIVFDATDQISQREIDTEKQVLGSRGVLDPVAQAYGVSVDDLSKSVSIEVQGETNALQLTVRNRDGESARKLAQAIAATYVQSVSRTSTGSLVQARGVLAQRIDELTARLGVVQTELANLPQTGAAAGGAKEQQLQSEAQILLQRIGSLQDGLTNLELVRLSQAGARIVTPAYVLEKPLEPQPIRALGLGCLIGLVIVAGMVFVRSRFPA
jgi:capsular polysaccharide biosynthesis protein